MILPYKLVIAYPLLTFSLESSQYNNLIPYQPYTTTNMIYNQDLKVYERFWDNIIKEEYDKIDKQR